jgi:hypothetical protein
LTLFLALFVSSSFKGRPASSFETPIYSHDLAQDLFLLLRQYSHLCFFHFPATEYPSLYFLQPADVQILLLNHFPQNVRYYQPTQRFPVIRSSCFLEVLAAVVVLKEESKTMPVRFNA